MTKATLIRRTLYNVRLETEYLAHAGTDNERYIRSVETIAAFVCFQDADKFGAWWANAWYANNYSKECPLAEWEVRTI